MTQHLLSSNSSARGIICTSSSQTNHMSVATDRQAMLIHAQYGMLNRCGPHCTLLTPAGRPSWFSRCARNCHWSLWQACPLASWWKQSHYDRSPADRHRYIWKEFINGYSDRHASYFLLVFFYTYPLWFTKNTLKKSNFLFWSSENVNIHQMLDYC